VAKLPLPLPYPLPPTPYPLPLTPYPLPPTPFPLPLPLTPTPLQDATEIVAKLRSNHNAAQSATNTDPELKRYGLDCISGKTTTTTTAAVVVVVVVVVIVVVVVVIVVVVRPRVHLRRGPELPPQPSP
jgi:T-complex protein 1 subunit alpha